ncbi:MAG: P-loop NTPase, partial [Clostridia bacterium]|nr:P-loop NTPase [Clostridia bacterium]
MGCSHNCSSCSENCSDRKQESLLVEQNSMSNVKNVIAIVSGKGGVGKSLVTSMLAVTMQRKGLTAAILDGDITGPSIPKEFGIYEKARGTEDGLFPSMTKSGIRIMSTNLLLENETDPVIWRGPVIAGMVKQFWS